MKALLLSFLLSIATIFCSTECCGETTKAIDSLEISLLTCEPHPAIYSLYGHTAIRVQNYRTGEDIAVNYGVFDFNTPNFFLRFALGRTDYCMGIVPFSLFCSEYRSYGSGVIEQVLNLTDTEKMKILAALHENYLPENREYRYNYFYDNCTTRARDMLIDNLERQVVQPPVADSVATYRSMIHDYNADYPWARWGNDILLGFQSDVNTTQTERQFLPLNLCADFDRIQLVSGDGSHEKLVKEKFYVVAPGIQDQEDGFPLRPLVCALILLILTVLVTVIEFVCKRWLWLYDTLLMILTGICGIILTMMIFSSHPTVNLNLQILIMNPLTLIFAYAVAKRACKHEIHWWWKVWTILIVLFLVGRLLQCYAEGMMILALSLLLRCISRNVLKKRLEHI